MQNITISGLVATCHVSSSQLEEVRIDHSNNAALIKKELVKGNNAIAMGAIEAGCLHYFGYPITPQNDIPEYMSKHLPKIGGSFLQAESEVTPVKLT